MVAQKFNFCYDTHLMKTITIHTDGAARGNPGEAGAGAVIKIQNSKFKIQNYCVKLYLGIATNNQAEYQALIIALVEAQKIIQKERIEEVKVLCYSDSELLVRQMKGEYRVKNKDLQVLFLKALELVKTFQRVLFIRIPREKNKEADALANEAIEKH
ncbi:MAG: Ribonuclease H [Parcubacteria group bacterium GW2011_GWC2_44_17]|uniref:RNase H type-1 domain-containing protein n=1 Tax=Candidatus Jacksonbacteria bacterium RIFCSPLOWO2_02_FULL_44_20 TaxID=1798460 RepID=A0A1G2A8P6_9BACT|nr:MAG: Ribonuclease H [Parcubacteria group bacterium GW2011_GWC2_44_17]OGY69705.1 MAG: hypothetical protein A3C00_04775 [Candidatus Jacksonbacteria bacterium RIFCSPHIGHO2_02_FULL_44_25]OGY73035.1 MAG: hypothetical protein A3H61_01915 [Candidatus Jacksonbacteria bacterium RIFCSPLOWO2_02_FULL_44_20]OGY74311.1 MAG: hypothetical protein A3H07_00970 [Candidatus Jacksonbacteria bacterium RIFCSPLOWO2_12_FULL_44_15b]